jgi:hypothetical protein
VRIVVPAAASAAARNGMDFKRSVLDTVIKLVSVALEKKEDQVVIVEKACLSH